MAISVKKTQEMMDTAERHYHEEQRKSGMVTPMPYAWVKNEETGALMIYTPWDKHAQEIEELLRQKFLF